MPSSASPAASAVNGGTTDYIYVASSLGAEPGTGATGEIQREHQRNNDESAYICGDAHGGGGKGGVMHMSRG